MFPFNRTKVLRNTLCEVVLMEQLSCRMPHSIHPIPRTEYSKCEDVFLPVEKAPPVIERKS